MNFVTQLTQFVGHDVINKNMTDLAVRCSTGSVELSCVAINTPLAYKIQGTEIVQSRSRRKNRSYFVIRELLEFHFIHAARWMDPDIRVHSPGTCTVFCIHQLIYPY